METGKTMLGWTTTPAMSGRQFSKMLVMGPYWSGTNAIREEVMWRFKAPVLNPDKLEVTATTRRAVQTLRDGIASGPVLREPLVVGEKTVPKGYKILVGPHSQAAPPAPPGRPKVDLAAADLEPPITACFGPDTGGHCEWWKHAVRQRKQGEINTSDDTLVVLVTKDPLFWLQSMSKHFYELKLAEGYDRSGLDALFRGLDHQGRRYRDAVELWSATMSSFLDENLYPSSRCVLVRYEDFLFRFWDVMVHLAAFLPAVCQRLKEPPNSHRSKTHGLHVRGREEALKFYAASASRHCEFTPPHIERMRELQAELLAALGYANVVPEVPPVRFSPWVPDLRAGDIVATRFRREDSWYEDEEFVRERHAGRGYARVVGSDHMREIVIVQPLYEVPREWLKENGHDWSAVEWPSEKTRVPLPKSFYGREQDIPREWVDLRLPYPSAPLDELPLTEESYRAIVALRSTPKMASFIHRVVSDLEVNGVRAGRVLDRRGLLGFARWFSGEANVQSLAQIRRELPGKQAERWITFVPPVPPRPVPPDPPRPAPPRPTRSLANEVVGSEVDKQVILDVTGASAQ